MSEQNQDEADSNPAIESAFQNLGSVLLLADRYADLPVS